MKAITRFEGFYSFLNNDNPYRIKLGDLEYPNITSAYYASLTTDYDQMLELTTLTPKEAREFSLRISYKENWNLLKVSIMEELLRIKFNPDSALFRLLLDTQDSQLKFYNDHGDIFWGINSFSPDEGKNVLGGLLMNIRDEHLTKKKCS